MEATNYYVYMILCEDNSYYTGTTNNPDRRWNAHVEGFGAKYTRSHKPVKMRLLYNNLTKSEALSLEWNLKRLSHTEKQMLFNAPSGSTEHSPVTRRPIC